MVKVGSEMKAHRDHLISRILKAASRVVTCRYRVVCVGIDNRDRIISIMTNSPRLKSRGYHAEERVIFSSPKSLSKLIIARVGSRGNLLPIDPCAQCLKLINRRGIKVERVETTERSNP